MSIEEYLDYFACMYGLTAEERALRIRRAIIDLARDLFIRDQVVFSSAPFANQFSLSQARWPGEGGSRPISRLEGTALASAIGRELSLLQSGVGQQPQQTVLFRPQVVSATLTPALVELRSLVRESGPLILLERPFQGCTVVATVQGPSPEEAVFRDGVGGAATVETAEQLLSPEEAPFRGREDGAAAVAAAEQTRGSEGADFRDGVGDAAAVEAAVQTWSPEGAGWRLLNKRGVLKGLVSGMELAMPRQ
jgi:hypothetical protein